MNETTKLDAYREFVSRFDPIPDVQFSAVPYARDSHQGIAYLLMVASVNQNTSAEAVRDLVAELHRELGDSLFEFDRLPARSYMPILERYRNWKLWEHVPRILSDAAAFGRDVERHGGFVERGRQQPDAATAVERIARRIHYMGRDAAGARKKVWMFMRWMVRPAPDIGVWSPPLRPAELMVPLDSNTGRAFLDMARPEVLGTRVQEEGLTLERDQHDNVASTATNVRRVTEMARWLFPDDPARVDYAFFCYGRRHGKGEETHRCWKVVGCDRCPIRALVRCPGRP